MADARNGQQAVIDREIAEKREALRAFRFAIAGSKAKNVKEGRTIRKAIARLLTEKRRSREKRAA